MASQDKSGPDAPGPRKTDLDLRDGAGPRGGPAPSLGPWSESWGPGPRPAQDGAVAREIYQGPEDESGPAGTKGAMAGELSKREGVLLHSFQSEAGSFCCSFHRFTKIYALITISLLDIGFKWCFVISFFCFERVHLAMRGCTCALRGCSRTLKTPNSPPLKGARRTDQGLLDEPRPRKTKPTESHWKKNRSEQSSRVPTQSTQTWYDK